MQSTSPEIEQIKEVKPPPKECPVPPPCPVCPPKPKPWQVCLKLLALLLAGLVLAFIILAASGLRITRKESLLDIWLASRKTTPTPEVLESTPTPDLTANWKTYTDERYGYSIKYPSDWDLVESSKTIDGEKRDSVLISCDIEDPYYAPITVQVYQNPKKLSIREWAEEFGWKGVILEFVDTEIDGQPAVEYKDGLGVLNFIVQKDDRIYSLSSHDSQENIEKQNLMMSQILSTFRFLE